MQKGSDYITIGMDVKGSEQLIRAFSTLQGDLLEIMEKSYEKVAAHFAFRVRSDKLRRKDHSLKELARLGHPYSTEYPRNIESKTKAARFAGASTESILGHDLIKVHRQGDEGLYKSIIHEIKRDKRKHKLTAKVGVEKNHDAEEYAKYVHDGTPKMKPRPFLKQQLEEMKDELKKKIHVYFSNEFWQAVNKLPAFKKGR